MQLEFFLFLLHPNVPFLRNSTYNKRFPIEKIFMVKTTKVVPKAVRNAVWTKFIPGNKCCWCCKVEPITVGNFHCGHIQATALGGDMTLPNLRPICGLCNQSMGTTNMMDFIEQYQLWEKTYIDEIQPDLFKEIRTSMIELENTMILLKMNVESLHGKMAALEKAQEKIIQRMLKPKKALTTSRYF